MSHKIETVSSPESPSNNCRQLGIAVKSLQDEQVMSDYQMSRELKEALRVQFMQPEERFHWLKDSWGHLQDESSLLFATVQILPGAARCYTSLAEKNRFDEDREINRALELRVTR
jgi:hypothetical protein